MHAIEVKLWEHDRQIAGLIEGQKRQNEALEEMSGSIGDAVREMSESSRNFVDAKSEILSAMGTLSDRVQQVGSGFESFKSHWKGVCDEKHKLTDFRLSKVEGVGDKVLREIDDMSEQSKVHYIRELEQELAEYEKQQQSKENRIEKVKDQRSNQIWTLIIAIVTGLLGGTGGTVLLQWLLGGK